MKEKNGEQSTLRDNKCLTRNQDGIAQTVALLDEVYTLSRIVGEIGLPSNGPDRVAGRDSNGRLLCCGGRHNGSMGSRKIPRGEQKERKEKEACNVRKNTAPGSSALDNALHGPPIAAAFLLQRCSSYPSFLLQPITPPPTPFRMMPPTVQSACCILITSS